MVTGQFTHHMSDEDALMWNIEKDPILRSTILAVAIFDSVARLGRGCARRIERTTRVIPRLRQRVRVAAVPHRPPRWTVEPTFDLDFHLRRTAARRARRRCARCSTRCSRSRRRASTAPARCGSSRCSKGSTARRRTRRARDEGAPLGHRRRRRHGAARRISSTSTRDAARARRRPTCPPRSRPSTFGIARRSCATRSRTPPPHARHRAARPRTASRRTRSRAMRDPVGRGGERRAHHAFDRPHARARDVPDVAGHARPRARPAPRGARRALDDLSRAAQGDRGQPQRRVRRRGHRRPPPLPRAARRRARSSCA